MLEMAGAFSGFSDDRPKKILEIGYGHGYFADVVCDRGWEYSCADISAPLVELGATNGHDVRFPDGFGHEMEGEFDVLWLSHVLEHATNWESARGLVAGYLRFLKPGGLVAIVGPDYLSWKSQFWSGDFSHGFPTTRRNVNQLLRDVGLEGIGAKYHRAGSTNLIVRALCAVLSLLPHGLLDHLVDRDRARLGEGFVYSWKTVFGWRQIMVWGRLEDDPGPSMG